MAYQKFRADQLFDGFRLRDAQEVLITKQDGTIEEIIPLADAGDDVQYHPGILSPGFVNCHCHLELSHMQGRIAEKTGLIEFVTRVMQDRHHEEELILDAINKAEQNMRESGIVAVGDICNNKLTLSQKSLNRLHYFNFIEASGFVPSMAGPRFERALDLFQSFAALQSGNEPRSSIVPHAPYSVSEELWKKITGFEGNTIMTMHNQEIADENELFLAKQGGFLDFYNQFKLDHSGFEPSGRSSLQTSLPRFSTGHPLLLVHNVFTSEEDLSFSKSLPIYRDISWCLCPNANLYISGLLPDMSLFLKQGLRLVLGTDSLASNNQLSITAEMKTLQANFPFVKTEELLQWATINGAQALHLDDILGSFESGKRPGVVLVEATFDRSKRLL